MSISGPPAILGGNPVHAGAWPTWPPALSEAEEGIKEVIRSRRWIRYSGHCVIDFEKALARRVNVKYSLAVWSGTDALACMMHGVDVQPGDEVLVTPYTFHTGAAAPLFNYALPIFVDVDRESFQMDPAKIEEKITPDTRAILVCHWGGQAADMDGVMALARKHRLAVCEDSYQAAFAEWRGRQLGTVGDVGMIGHTAEELLACGEGATLISDNEEIMSRCYYSHDFGRDIAWDTHHLFRTPDEWQHFGRNMKVMEVQGALLLAALQHADEWSQRRVDNGKYLRTLLQGIDGIRPQKEYDGQTRPAYRHFLFRYDRQSFHGLPIDQFVRALQAEGIPVARGMKRPLSRELYLEAAANSSIVQQLFSEARIESMRDSFHCPNAESLCREAVGLQGGYLQAPRADMDMVRDAILKVQQHSEELRGRMEKE